MELCITIVTTEVFCEEKVSTVGILLPLTPFVPVLDLYSLHLLLPQQTVYLLHIAAGL